MDWVKNGYKGLVKGENWLGNVLLLIIRLYWGVLLVITGFGKLMNLQGVGDYFATLHLPLPHATAFIVGTLEIIGGLSLILGLFSRVFSLILVILFLTALATAHKEAFFGIFSNPAEFIKQEPFLYLYASLIVLCFGPGLFSFDHWLEKRTYGHPL